MSPAQEKSTALRIPHEGRPRRILICRGFYFRFLRCIRFALGMQPGYDIDSEKPIELLETQSEVVMPIPEFLSQNDISKLASVNQRTVARWYKEGLPCEEGGHRGARKTTPKQFMTFYKARIQKQTISSMQGLTREDGEPLSQEAESLRLTKEQADKVELANKQTRRILGSIEDFNQSFRRAMIIIRQVIMGIPGRMAVVLVSETDAAVIKQMLQDECKRALTSAVQSFWDERDEDFEDEDDELFKKDENEAA